VRFRARDNFSVFGPVVAACRHVADPDQLQISIDVEGRPAFTTNTSHSVRGVARLLTDVTDFMTLSAGDVITLGAPFNAPVVHAGEHATLCVGELPPLQITFVAPHAKQGAA
jgi:5-oxopent-3-ene-1,2,5-tricarboxylate decarboxylase/2-hydroxyhepta-2,4-diene-1,7-dioate isomerase